MRARLTGAAAALLLAVLVTPAAAQDPTATVTPSPTATPTPSATPTPTATPTPEEKRDERDRNSKAVKRIYRDFERDGRIDNCDYTLKALKKARRSIEDSYKEEYPDFRDVLTAAIERHREGDCEEQEQALEDANSDPTATPTATATPAPSGGTGTTPTTPVTPPSTTPDSGSLPDFGDSGSGGSGGQVEPLPEDTPAPGEDAIPEGTPAPTPAPVATPTPTPSLIVTRAAASPNMFVPGALLTIALLGLLIAGLTALLAKRSDRLAGVNHAWREAAWRTSGAWSDFSDWLRSKR